MPSKPAIVFINGFRQGAGPGEGLWRLYQRACNRWYDRRDSLVLYRTFDSNHEETAALINDSGAEYVALCGYSYGAGYGCTQLAAALSEHRHLIDDLFLIDPVPRYSLLPAKVLSLTRAMPYRVPVNVVRTHSFRQVHKRGPFDPVGHKLELGTTATCVVTDWILGGEQELKKYGDKTVWPASSSGPGVRSEWRIDYTVNHSNIDDHQKIHDLVVATVALHAPPTEHTQ